MTNCARLFTLITAATLGGCYSGVTGDRGGPAANDDDDAAESVGEAGDDSSCCRSTCACRTSRP